MAPRFFGHLLRNRRADRSLSVWEKLRSDDEIVISSPAFADGGVIPKTHAGPGVGDNVSPALSWHGVAVQADHLVFILEDVDSPFTTPFIHTMAILSPHATSLAEGGLGKDAPGIHFIKGMMGSGYSGPRPIVGHDRHHYRFMLFGVAGDIDTSSQRAAIASMVGHVVARGRLVGTYER